MNNGILVIDDNVEMQELLNLLLTEEGFDVISATNGSQAVDLLKVNHDISLILLDLTLPDMKCAEFLSKIKIDHHSKLPPIILFSAVPSLNQMVLPEGVVDVIQKPFQINEFLNVINMYKSAPVHIKIDIFSKNKEKFHRVS